MRPTGEILEEPPPGHAHKSPMCKKSSRIFEMSEGKKQQKKHPKHHLAPVLCARKLSESNSNTRCQCCDAWSNDVSSRCWASGIIGPWCNIFLMCQNLSSRQTTIRSRFTLRSHTGFAPGSPQRARRWDEAGANRCIGGNFQLKGIQGSKLFNLLIGSPH